MCNVNHDIDDYTYYLQQKMEAGSKFQFKNKLCHRCLVTVTKEHKTCSSRRTCKVCNEKNVTTFHDNVITLGLKKEAAINSDKGLADDEKNQGGVKCASVNTGTDVISMCLVAIKVQYDNPSKVLKTHALLDSCNEGSFILERLINNLPVKGQKTSITIKTLNEQVANKAMVVKGLKVTTNNGDSNGWLEFPDTYTEKYLSVDKDDTAAPSKLKQWKHLERQNQCISVGLLIGTNFVKALKSIDIIPSKNDGPMQLRPN